MSTTKRGTMRNLYKCVTARKANSSQAREAIYEVLYQAENCMSVAEIMEALKISQSKKVSLNTVYRHLTLFVECELAIVIQDDSKTAYYILVSEKAMAFSLCPKCNYLTGITSSMVDPILETLESTDFLTIHQKCIMCT